VFATDKWRSAALAIGVIALAVVIGIETFAIPVTPLYAKVGPRVFPIAVAIGMGLLGLALLRDAFKGTAPALPPEEDQPVDLGALAWLGAGLVLNIALIGWLGFCVASTVLFMCVARSFGSRQWLRNGLIGAAFAVITFVGFDRGLGISIGAGYFGGIL
jgi:putative tricarboxylic transport membrane protein